MSTAQRFWLRAVTEGGADAVHEVADGPALVLGRGADAGIAVADPRISRKHAEVWVMDKQLAVKRMPGSANPIFYRGGEHSLCFVSPGEVFVAGKTRFLVLDRSPEPESETRTDAPAPKLSHTLEQAEVFAGDARSERMRLLDLLELPEILATKTAAEFQTHVASLLRLGTGARWACVAREDGGVLARDADQDVREDQRLSRGVIQAALRDAPRPTFYSWAAPPEDMSATLSPGTDWAICAAVKIPGESAMLFYAAGRERGGDTAQVSRENARFVGLVADIVGRSLSVRRLEGYHTRLKRFFSGPVASRILDSQDPRELEPKLAESTVMFFDLRGFSRRTEGRNDRILEHLGELRGVMTAMTDRIFAEGGVVLSYMGDGILACWNVPITEPRHVDRACHAALAMSDALRQIPGDWRCGIGLHTGEVVAGTIGSDQMFSYGVMGAVVNQASRVEGITKVVEVPVLVTREVAERVSAEVAVATRIGRYQPAGMDSALDLYELRPPPAVPERQDIFGRGLDALEQGAWERAYELLDRLGPGDRPARYLMALAEQFRRRPPRNWAGIIELIEK